MGEFNRNKCPDGAVDGVSRRQILGSVGAGAIANTAISSATAEDTATIVHPCSGDDVAEIRDAPVVRQLEGQKRYKAMAAVKSKAFKRLERHVLERHSVRSRARSIDAALVMETTSTERYSVTISYDEARTENEELFIHYNGLDEHPDSVNHVLSDMPTLVAYHATYEGDDIVVTRYTVEGRNVVSERERSSYAKALQYQPACGGGGGCGTCWVYTGVDCAPSLSCLVTIVARVGSNILVCGKCAASIGLSPACALCAGLTYAHYYDPPSCLGCADTKWVCVDEDLEGTVC